MSKLQRPDYNTLRVVYRDLDIRIRRQLIRNPRFWVERIRIVRKQLRFSLDVPSREAAARYISVRSR